MMVRTRVGRGVPLTPSTLLSAFEILADLFPDGVLVVGDDGIIQAASDEFSRIVLSDRASIVGQQLEQFVPVRHRSDHVDSRERFFDSGGSRPMGVGLGLHALRSDGSEVPIDVSLRSVDLDGSRVVIAAVRDLTAQHEAEKTRSTLEIVRRATRSAVLVIEASGVIVGTNDAATRLLGVDAHELVDRRLEETIVGATDQVMDIFDDCSAGGHVEDVRIELVTTWDERVPVNLTAHPVVSSRGQISAVSMLMFDRSEMEASQAALRQFQERLEITERLGGIGSWEFDGHTRELQMSPGLHELLGLSPFDAEGTADDLLGRMSPEFAHEIRGALDRCVETGTSMSFEGQLLSVDGRSKWITVEGNRDSTGVASPHRVVGIVQDVSARHDAMATLLEADRLKDEFLSTVSHELRTPLTVIVGFADHLRSQGDASTAPYLEAMHRNAMEMGLMVDQLLDLSRVQSGRVSFEPVPARLSSLVRDALGYLGTMVSGHRVIDETSDVEVRVDPMGFRRVLTNLLSNAAKFSPPDSTITISDELDQGDVVVSVRDQGVGLAPDDVGSIFDMFVQARHGRPVDVPGTGVGLTIVKRYVEMHGGRVWAESQPGAGACFRFTIPAGASDSGEDDGA